MTQFQKCHLKAHRCSKADPACERHLGEWSSWTASSPSLSMVFAMCPFHLALHSLHASCKQMVLGLVNIQDTLSTFNYGIQDNLLKRQNVTQLSSQREFCQELLLVGYKSSEPCTWVSRKLFSFLQSLRCDTCFFAHPFESSFKEEQYDR